MEGIHLSNKNEPKSQVEDAVDMDRLRSASPELGVAVITSAPPVMIDSTPQSMLAFMVQQNVDIERMKAMIDLVHAEEERAAKQTFALKFAQMQAKFEAIPRSARAMDKEKELYDYAPIEAMVKTNGRIIGDHGFSYSFREELLEDGKTRRFFLDIQGWGHTKTTFVDLPDGGAKAPLMNAAQASRSLQSYGQRYAMFAGFGFVTEGEDDDTAGLTFEFGVTFSNEIDLIRNSDRDNWKANYAMAIKDKAPEDVEKLAVIKGQLIKRFKEEDGRRS